MCYKVLFCISLIFLLSTKYSIQAEQNTTLTPVAATSTAETNKTNGLLCEEGYSESSNCTKCALDYEIKDGKCSKIKSESNSSIGRGRRIFFIFVASVLTVILIVSMFAVYRHLNQQNRRRSLSNPRNVSSSSNTNTNTNNRFANILRRIGLDKRRPFNMFSISNNNNNPSGQRQPMDSSRAPLSENPDEALLADDPYADGGSANPYKTLTLAIT